LLTLHSGDIMKAGAILPVAAAAIFAAVSQQQADERS
jgi:hypothetical protein